MKKCGSLLTGLSIEKTECCIFLQEGKININTHNNRAKQIQQGKKEGHLKGAYL